MRGFWLILLLGSAIHAQPAPPSPLGNLHYLEIRDFLTELYALGDVRTAGVLKAQRDCLESAHQEWRQSRDLLDLKKKLEACLSQQTRYLDRRFEFERQTREDPRFFDQSYQRILDLLPEGRRTPFHAIRRLQLEVDRQRHLLVFPVFADAFPFAGWDLQHLHAYLELILSQQLPDSVTVDEDLWTRLFSDATLDLSEFQKFIPLLSASTSPERSYLQYLFFGQHARNHHFVPGSLRGQWEAAYRVAENAGVSESSLEIARGWIQEVEFFDTLLSISWRLKNEVQGWRERRQAEDLSGIQWLLLTYGTAWAGFTLETPLDEIARHLDDRQSDPRLLELPHEVLEWMHKSGEFSDDQIQDFELALLEVESLRFAELELDESVYRRLTPELRRIIAALLLPRISVSAALEILDLRFFDLPPFEQAQILERLFAYQEDRQEFFQQWKDYDPRNTSAHVAFHQDLVQASLAWRREPLLDDWIEDPNHIRLSNGTLVQSSAGRRQEMRDFLQENPEVLKSTWLPEFIVHGFLVHLVPDQNYWRDEWLKAKSEWTRQVQLGELSQERRELLASENFSTEELNALETRLKQLFKDEAGHLRYDGSSPGMLGASFIRGFTAHPERVALGVAGGVILTLVFKYAGAKWAFGIIATDTGIRFTTAARQSPDDLEWYEIPLQNGFSTPLGLATAQMIQDTYELALLFSDWDGSANSLEALFLSGELLSESLAFSVGSYLTHRIFPARLYAWGRFQKAQQRRWRRYQRQIDDIYERTHELRTEIQQLEARRLDPTRTPRELQQLAQQIRAKQAVYSQLLYGITNSSPNRLRFLVHQTGRLLLHAGESLFLFRGFSIKNLFSPRQISRYWRRSSQLGKEQYEASLREIVERYESGLQRHSQRLVPEEYNRIQSLQKAHQELSRAHQRFERSLSRYEEAMTKSAPDRATLPLRELERMIQLQEARWKDLNALSRQADQISFRPFHEYLAIELRRWRAQTEILLMTHEKLKTRFFTDNFAAKPGELVTWPHLDRRLTQLEAHRLDPLFHRRFSTNELSLMELLAKIKDHRMISPAQQLRGPEVLNLFSRAEVLKAETSLPFVSSPGSWRRLQMEGLDIYLREVSPERIEIKIGKHLFGEWRHLYSGMTTVAQTGN